MTERAPLGRAIGWAAAAALAFAAALALIWGLGGALAGTSPWPPGRSPALMVSGCAAAHLVLALVVAFAARNGIRRDRAEPVRQLTAAVAEAGLAWLSFGAGVGVAAALDPAEQAAGTAVQTATELGLQGAALAIPAAALPVIFAARTLIAGRRPGAARRAHLTERKPRA